MGDNRQPAYKNVAEAGLTIKRFDDSSEVDCF